MKGCLSCDNLVPVFVPLIKAVLAGQLDGRFIGLCTRIAEKDPLTERVLTQQLGQLNLGRNMVVVGAVDQGGSLILYRLDHLGMAVAKVVDGDTRQKVKVCLAVDIGQPAASTALGDERIATVSFGNVSQAPFNPVL